MVGAREWLGFVLASTATSGLATLALYALSQPIELPEDQAAGMAAKAMYVGVGFLVLVCYVIAFAVVPATIARWLARGRGIVVHLFLGPLVAFGAICISDLVMGRGLPNGDLEVVVWMVSAILGAAVYFWVIGQGDLVK